MSESDELVRRIRRMLDAYPSDTDFPFPLGGRTSIPLKEERDVLDSAPASLEQSREVIGTLRNDLAIHSAYCLVIFGVRMAILGVRTGSIEPLKMGLFALVVDDGLVDWRDALSALALVENCARRLGIDFDTEAEALAALASADRRKTILEGYLSRSAEMREIDVMGYQAVGSGEDLTFVHRNYPA